MFRDLIREAFKARKRTWRQRGGRSPSRLSQSRRLFFESLERRTLLASVISGTTHSPVAPAASNPFTISSTVTDSYSLTSVNLTYTTNVVTGSPSTVFSETFGTTATSAGQTWPGGAGTGTDNLWTVAGTPDPFKLASGANYTSSTTAVGVQFACSKVSSASITTTSSYNFAGASATVTFYVKTANTTSYDSVTLQTSPNDSTFTSCVPTAGTANSNGFTPYTYNLGSSQLVNGLYLRFLFSGSTTDASTDNIFLDQITVSMTPGSASTTTIAMSGSSGTYSATIPAESSGTTVGYYVTAKDSAGATTTDPATAPTTTYSYTVRAADTAPSISGTVQSPATATSTSPVWITTTTTDLSALTVVNLVYNTGSGPVTLPMYDDGQHEDGAASDGTYSASNSPSAASSAVPWTRTWAMWSRRK